MAKAAVLSAIFFPALLFADSIDDALAMAGLARETARFDENIIRLYSFDEFTLPSFRSIESDPWRGLRMFESLRGSVGASLADPGSLLMATRPWTGEATRRDLLGSPTAAWQAAARTEGALESALRRIGATEVPPADVVPEPVRQAAALVLLAAISAKPYYDAAFVGVGDLDAALFSDLSPGAGPTATITRLRLLRAADLKFLYTAAVDLLAACKVASDWVADVRFQEVYKYEVRTPWGLVTLSGGSRDVYGPGSHLLIIDTAGDDIYLGGARANPSCWFSALIDTNGEDMYVSEQADIDGPISQRATRTRRTGLGPAAAHFGLACLIDLDGDDLYRSEEPSQGSARYGVAALYDAAGNDTYDAYADSQGFGMCGAGLLVDLEGDDDYAAFTQSQGCGLVKGIGILADAKGDDSYVANDAQIDFPSAQSTEHNISMSQGAGFGVRADYTDGHSLGGGLGVLYDGAGNDTYRCGVFGQGVGYWQGIGALFDVGGNDTYYGAWYVQGACAHFAVGYLEDGSGDDKYVATMNMAQGAGHDFSIGYLIDRSGNDSYTAPNLSLGAGNANGIGIFIDYLGNDTYDSRGTTLGRVNVSEGTIRGMAFSLGLFIDLGGTNTFPAGVDWAGDGKRTLQWARREERASDSQVGIFYSR